MQHKIAVSTTFLIIFVMKTYIFSYFYKTSPIIIEHLGEALTALTPPLNVHPLVVFRSTPATPSVLWKALSFFFSEISVSLLFAMIHFAV